MSSDDDRDYMDVDADVEVDVEGIENENEERPRMEMPSSDDMDLFQIVTPVPRRIKPIGRVCWRKRDGWA
ncbi:hypothetical protein FRC07_014838 [Ceratobasidium sp. 392]|nr:hypothetical protein FRC07_014838 [Ceratobasidium sp. 392]